MRTRLPAVAAAILLVLVAAVAGLRPAAAATIDRQDGTPSPTYSCDGASPTAGMGTDAGTPMPALAMGTPMASMGMEVEFDQLYIDMMIPHHASIMAMAQAALPRLTNERLHEIAQRIIDTQGPEIEDLRGFRQRFYGSAEPMPMDEQMMSMMDRMMPGVAGSMGEMATQMDAASQVAAFCAAEDPDVAFIDLTIPHHRGAIAASVAALDQATHDEVRAFAQRVITDQQREIDELNGIRVDLVGGATPAAVAA